MAVDPFYCASCRQRSGATGFCPQCPDEPLLDLRQPEVRNTLDELDARARHSRQGKVVLGSVVLIGIPFWFLTATILGDIVGVIAAAGLSSVAAALFMKLVPIKRQLPELSTHEWSALDDNAAA